MTRRGVISERERFHAISLGPVKATQIECSIPRADRLSEVWREKSLFDDHASNGSTVSGHNRIDIIEQHVHSQFDVAIPGPD
jgi:hypothetical protein